MPRPNKSVTLRDLTFKGRVDQASGHVVHKVEVDGKLAFFKPCYQDLNLDAMAIAMGTACHQASELDKTYPPSLAKWVIATSVDMRNSMGDKAAEAMLVFDETGERIIGTVSIGLPNFEPMLSFNDSLPPNTVEGIAKKKRVVPDVERLIYIDAATSIFGAQLRGEDDLHPNNLDSLARLFDFDMTWYFRTKYEKGEDSTRVTPNKFLKPRDVDTFPRYSGATHAPAKSLPGNYNYFKKYRAVEAFRALERNHVFRRQYFEAMVNEILAHDENSLQAQLYEYLGDERVGLDDALGEEDNKVQQYHAITIPEEGIVYLGSDNTVHFKRPACMDGYTEYNGPLDKPFVAGETRYLNKAVIQSIDPDGHIKLHQGLPLRFESSDGKTTLLSEPTISKLRKNFGQLKLDGTFNEHFLAYKSRKMDDFYKMITAYVDQSKATKDGQSIDAKDREFQTMGGFLNAYPESLQRIKARYTDRNRAIPENLDNKYLQLLRDSHRRHFSEKLPCLVDIIRGLAQETEKPVDLYSDSSVVYIYDALSPDPAQVKAAIEIEYGKLNTYYQEYYENNDSLLQANQDFVSKSLVCINTLKAMKMTAASSEKMASFCKKYEELIGGVTFGREAPVRQQIPAKSSPYLARQQRLDISVNSPEVVDELSKALVCWLSSQDICGTDIPPNCTKPSLLKQGEFRISQENRREQVREAIKDAFKLYSKNGIGNLAGYFSNRTFKQSTIDSWVAKDDSAGYIATALSEGGKWNDTSLRPKFMHELTKSMLRDYQNSPMRDNFPALFSVNDSIERGELTWTMEMGATVSALLQKAFYPETNTKKKSM